MFIFARLNHGEHRFRDLGSRQCPTVLWELVVSSVAVVLFAVVLVVLVALLVAAGTGKLARLDGATYPAALMRSAAAFAAVLTLAAAVTGALSAILN
ncbi:MULTISPECIES: hypothetical protein [Streptomyces]|uniref:hypothetical protein n=1 Tax=Streptomyces TaxID=1883 RepID=UPI002E28CB31|nr:MULTISPECIES: hypothetical protein [Streptomyces]